MKVARLTRAALVITAAALLSCGEPPLSPVPPPQASLIGSLLQATGLLHCTPLPTATATQTVGPAGGVIKVGPHTLSIPAGALGGGPAPRRSGSGARGLHLRGGRVVRGGDRRSAARGRARGVGRGAAALRRAAPPPGRIGRGTGAVPPEPRRGVPRR